MLKIRIIKKIIQWLITKELKELQSAEQKLTKLCKQKKITEPPKVLADIRKFLQKYGM